MPLKSRLKKCNILKPKVETVLQDGKKNPSRKPLVIKGVRQCGKTFSVQRFAEENYAHNVYIDFYEMEEAKATFRGSKKVDDIVRGRVAELFLEQVRMSTSSGKFEYLQLVVICLSVYQQPIRFDMTFPITDIIPLQRMVFLLFR